MICDVFDFGVVEIIGCKFVVWVYLFEYGGVVEDQVWFIGCLSGCGWYDQCEKEESKVF